MFTEIIKGQFRGKTACVKQRPYLKCVYVHMTHSSQRCFKETQRKFEDSLIIMKLNFILKKNTHRPSHSLCLTAKPIKFLVCTLLYYLLFPLVLPSASIIVSFFPSPFTTFLPPFIAPGPRSNWKS